MNITDTISARAREMPEAPAFLMDAATLSFFELDRAISNIAAAYKIAGLEPGQVAALNLTNQTQHLIASLAVARLGAGQIAFDAADHSPRVQAELRRRLKVTAMVAAGSGSAAGGLLELPPPPSDINQLKELEAVEFAASRDPDLPFLYLNTSGTESGMPRIGLLTHGLADHHFATLGPDLPSGPGSRSMSLASINFIGAKKNIYRFLLTGGCFALMDAGEDGPNELVEFVNRHRIGSIHGSLVHASALLRIAAPGELLLPHVEALRIGATTIPDIVRQNIRESITPNLFISYGITEFGLIAVAPPSQVRSVPGVVGKLLPGIEAVIVGEDGQSLPAGQVGRLRLKSAGMSEGYIGNPEETRRDFQDGWFLSSDLASFTEAGELVHHGRADDLMIFDGINIFPAEIENVLLHHAAVTEAAAFPIRSPVRGDIPAAAVVVQAEVSETDLLAHCSHWLGLHKPHGIKIVAEFPRNVSGKVAKEALAKLFGQG